MATGMTDPIAELATLSTAELRARWERAGGRGFYAALAAIAYRSANRSIAAARPLAACAWRIRN